MGWCANEGVESGSSSVGVDIFLDENDSIDDDFSNYDDDKENENCKYNNEDYVQITKTAKTRHSHKSKPLKRQAQKPANNNADIFFQEKGCRVLHFLAAGAGADKQKLKLLVREPYFAHQVVLSAMRSYPQIAAIQEHGCGALANLAIDDDNQKLLVREPYVAHQVVLSAMCNHPQNTAVQEFGCGALRSLADDSDNQKLLVREPYLAHQVILFAMHNHPQIAEVQEQGCAALRNLAVDLDNQKLLVREPHLAHQAVLSAMRNHPQIAEVQEHGCAALLNLAAGNDDNKKLFVQNDAHFTMIAALIAHPLHDRVQLYAVWALSNLSVEVSNRAALEQADAVPVCKKAQRNFPNSKDLAARLETLEQNLA